MLETESLFRVTNGGLDPTRSISPKQLPEVTVVLATWNGAAHLMDLLSSILVQTLRPVQIIILDDGSLDGTIDLLNKFALRIPWTVLMKHETNQGVLTSYEELLTMVETEYFALCDQDDVWLPDKLEKTVELLASSSADLAYTDLKVVGESLGELAPSMWHRCNIAPVAGHPIAPLIIRNSVTGCTVVGRTSMLAKALPFPTGTPVHDWWLALVASAGRGIVPLHSTTVLYRQHGNNAIGAYSGLWRRLVRRELRLSDFLEERLSARRALIAGLQERKLIHTRFFLAWFYRRSSSLRFLLSPIYLAYTTVHASALGIRNLAIDCILTCVPIGPVHRRRNE